MKAPYPGTLDEGALIANCERLGIPLPLIACGGMGGWYASQGTLRKGVTSASGAAIGSDDVFTLDLTGASTSRARYPAVYIANDMTVIARCKPTLQTANASCGPLNKMTGISNVTSEWCLGLNLLNSGTEYKPWFGVCIGTTLHSALDPDTWAVNERLTLGGVRRYDRVEVYRNGVLKKIGTCGTGAINNVITDIQLGQWGAGGSFNLSAQFSVILIWDVALPVHIVAELTADPWMLWDESPLLNSDVTFHNPINTQTVSQTLLLTSLVALPRGVETEVGSNLDRAPLGSRQTVRIGSRIYTVAVDATKTYVLYSDDEGDNWTSEQIGTFVAASAQLVHGDSSQPILVVRQDSGALSTLLLFYQRTSGGSWGLIPGPGVATSTSCNAWHVMYDGTTYHIVFAALGAGGLNTRDVRYRSSSDCGTWSSIETLESESTVSNGPHEDRALAACMDMAGDIHLVYCITDGTDYKLVYRKRTSGTWSAAETIETIGPDNSPNNRAIHLSIVTDKNSKPHLFGVKWFTGTKQVVYYERTGSSWTAAERIYAVATDQDYPSAGLRERLYPNVVFHSSVSDGTVHLMQRDPSNVWNRSVISTTSTATQTEQCYDTFRAGSRPLEGQFIVYRSSVLVFVTSQLVWGDGGASDGTAAFSHNVHLYGRDGVRQTLTFSSVVNDPGFDRSHSVASLLPFSQVISTSNAIPRSPTSPGPRFSQDVGFFLDPASGNNVIAVGITHSVDFYSAFTGSGKTRVKTVTHTLTLTQVGPGLEYEAEVESDILFEQSVVGRGIRNKSLTNTATFESVVFMNKSIVRGVTSAVAFGSTAVRLRAWVWNSTHFDPGWAAEYEGDVGIFVIQGPDELPTISMTLPKPDFDDDNVVFRRDTSVRRNRTGSARTFVVPVYQSFRYGWSGLMRKRAEEFRQAVTPLLGKTVRILDHNGVTHRCVITGPTIVASQKGPEFVNVSIEFEKTEAIG